MAKFSVFSLLRLIGAVTLSVLAIGVTVAAQDDDHQELGLYIHAGTCDELGERVAEIGELELDHHGDDNDDDDRDRERVWERVGGDEPRPDRLWAEEDDVHLTLDELVSGQYVITVHAAESARSDVLACGAIGGEVDADGGLLIDIQEANGSGYEGRAYLIPDPDPEDPNETDIYIGLWEAQGAGSATPASTPTA